MDTFQRIEHAGLLRCKEIYFFKDRVMPHFEKSNGRPLKEKLIEEGALHPAELMDYVKKLLKILEFLNNEGFSYGFINVNDIYVTEDD
jgi:hypothetical protein